LEIIPELSSLKKDSEKIMLTKSSKSRLAAMALMALGVTTFMGTSAALASDHEEVTIYGEVVPCSQTTTTLSSATFPSMGEIDLGDYKTENITFTMAQGINAACVKKSGTVTAVVNPAGFFGSASPNATNPVTVTVGIVGTPDASGVGLIPVTATVPAAAETGDFGAVVSLTLVDDA
jgi:hypothetical protein